MGELLTAKMIANNFNFQAKRISNNFLSAGFPKNVIGNTIEYFNTDKK